MLGIDTNVLVRFLVQDDIAQSREANRIFEMATDENPILINNIVICEFVWVLSRAYKYEKSLIINVIEQLLSASDIKFENTGTLRQALQQYKYGNADFSDYLIALINIEYQAQTTYTFDKKASKNSLFTLLR